MKWVQSLWEKRRSLAMSLAEIQPKMLNFFLDLKTSYYPQLNAKGLIRVR